jgi:hypothetical protein
VVSVGVAGAGSVVVVESDGAISWNEKYYRHIRILFLTKYQNILTNDQPLKVTQSDCENFLNIFALIK